MDKPISYFIYSARYSKVALAFVFMFISMIRCTDFVRIDIPDEIISKKVVFSDDSVATAALRGIYSEMIQGSSFSCGDYSSVTFLTGFSADELRWDAVSDNAYQPLGDNQLLSSDPNVSILWSSCYRVIYLANNLLEGLRNNPVISPTTHTRLEGEAKFVRAFAYFYLTNLYGHVPLTLTTDYMANASTGRASVDSVYGQIEKDLTSAATLLTTYPSGRRARPNVWAAHAMLARVYLYRERWAMAAEEATAVINSNVYILQPDVKDVFLANNGEAIWQLRPNLTNVGVGTWEAQIFFGLPWLDQELMEAFEDNDHRIAWTDTVFTDVDAYGFTSNKYRVLYVPPEGISDEEYSMVLRFAEQYLIRAEARVHLHDTNGAIADIDMIRGRAGLPLLADVNPGADEATLLLAIEQERRIEFMAEWGHRWLDLKRTRRADAVLGDKKSATWQSTDVLYPVPYTEILNDPKLSPQNDGY